MIIGRESEISLLKSAQHANQSDFIAVFGRRRVGKTFLIREALQNKFAFYHTGIAGACRQEQLARFAASMRKYGLPIAKAPKNWFEAFDALETALPTLGNGKKTIFLDELPWMDTQKSNFVSALESFWNGWASARNDILLIVCGSATSWITSKIINNRGGLHNRLTHRIRLEPFTLHECEDYLQSRGIIATRMQILEYYMAMGGVPYYWSFIDKARSPSQNLDAMFFSANGELRDEYDHLYASLFKKPMRHMAIVSALGTKKVCMTREELLTATKQSDNGAFGVALEELVSCGFLRRFRMPGKKKRDLVYQLIDNYTLFYYRFLSQLDADESGSWQAQQNEPKVNVWRGLSFERVCLQHLEQIKASLGISGIRTKAYAWRSPKAQIDLLIERGDDAVNVCEMKYSSGEYSLTQEEHDKILNRRETYCQEAKPNGAVYLTLITPKGLVRNALGNDIQSVVTLDALFG